MHLLLQLQEQQSLLPAFLKACHCIFMPTGHWCGRVTCVPVWPQLVEERERLSTEVTKQKYRVQHHILPYVEELRAEIARLKAAGKSSVSTMNSGMGELSLSAA